MTGSTIFPKIDGDIFYASDVTTMSNIAGPLFKNYSQLLYTGSNNGTLKNGSYITLDFYNQKYDTLMPRILTGVSGIGDYLSTPINAGTVIDEFSDSSIDTDIWFQSGAVTEGAGYVTMVSTTDGTKNGLYQSGTASVDLNVSGLIVLMNYKETEAGTAGRSSFIVLIDDSANAVSLKTWGDGTSVDKSMLRLDILPGTDEVMVGTDPHVSGASVDVSSLTDGDKWRLGFYSINDSGGGGAGTSTFTAYNIRYISGTAGSGTFISTSTNAEIEITNAILVANTSAGSTVGSFWMSANEGANWEEATLNKITYFTTTGSELVVKATLFPTTNDTFQLNQYAAMYNII